ncbi:hypothetical protein LTR70_005683 [Exophiala xenobiotica]|uniref:Uncharacterized protein n=1 Tax=Lithohypha guttulata TaxID=1690604 RepID=A0ABR0KD16_9EURO|nr:hypothetical protein LTR24_004066 [Lithohypha guttulata]KAK5317678.1 hypothetical protein LTR70_005683 [Exophiala xenobiotica]
MSLSRVTSVEGFERNSIDSHVSSTRRLSFNPMPSPSDAKARVVQELQFQEVSKSRRVLQVGIAIVYCLFAAGIVFGYAAIKPVLIDEGVYKNYCTREELREGTTPCYGQEIRLNLMFTIAAVSTNVAALPIGTILDRFGPRVCGIIGSLLLTLGALLFAFAGQASVDAYIPGYLFLALGGPFVFISSFQLSNTFPQHSGLVLALLTGAFDSSSALFLLFRLLYESTNGRLSTQRLFLIYLVVPVFILVVQLFVMPKESYKSISEVVGEVEEEAIAPTPPEYNEDERQLHRERRDSTATEIQSLLDKSTNKKRADREEQKNDRSGVWGALHGYTAWEQIKTWWFVLITLFTVVQMTRINYFVATVRSQERWLLGSEARAETVNEFFDIALPVGGVLSIPFIGTVLDHTSTPIALGILVFFATVIGVLGCLPYMWAAIGNVALFVIYRPFYYTAVSDYSAKVFGFQTFGKVYGLIICLAGILNFIQSPLDALTHTVFNLNPIPINLILLACAVAVGTALVAYTAVKSRNMKRQQLEVEAEGATDNVMPAVNGTSYGTN